MEEGFAAAAFSPFSLILMHERNLAPDTLSL